MWTFTAWTWWIIAAGLMTLEVILPSTYFRWSGISAGIVGVIMWFAPDFDLTWQIFLFACLSVTSVLVFKKYTTSISTPKQISTLNQRAHQYIGRTFTLEKPISNGLGTVKVDDSRWKISGDDCEVGTRVRVTEIIDSCIFKVDIIK